MDALDKLHSSCKVGPVHPADLRHDRLERQKLAEGTLPTLRASGSLMGETGERQEAIFAAAIAIFLRFGFKKTSMDDLARAAGLSRQGLYLHFASKDALFK